MTETYKILKASPIDSKTPIESVTIEIDQSIDKAFDEARSKNQLERISDLKGIFKRYDNEAEKLVEALKRSLPQGTMDRLIAKLLTLKAAEMGYKGLFDESL